MSDDAWPDSLDALIAAPRHHTLLLENEAVRVFETRIPAGDTAPLYTHRWPSVYYIIRWSDFVRRDPEGNILVDTRVVDSKAAAQTALWSEPLPPQDPNQRVFAQTLLDNALEEYFLLQLAMFANKKVNAHVTIKKWKDAGSKLPAEGTPEFFPYGD